jgi:hypothetical protein
VFSRNRRTLHGLARIPRFYFDLRQNGLLTTDEEGEELPDLDAAEREAALLAAHLTAELFKAMVLSSAST